MFANSSAAMKMAEQFAAQQRAREIAAKGYSNINLMNAPKKKQSKPSPSKQVPGSQSSCNGSVTGDTDDSSSFSSSSDAFTASKGATPRRERQQEVIDAAMAKVDLSIDAQRAEQASVISKIDRHSKMALARLEHSHTTKGATLSMGIVKGLQEDHVHFDKILDGLMQLKYNLDNGLSNPSAIAKAITEVTNVELKRSSDRSYTDEELLAELRQGQFIPTRKQNNSHEARK